MDLTISRIVSEDELTKLATSGLKFSVSRKHGKIAVKYKADLKDKVNELLGSTPKSMKI